MSLVTQPHHHQPSFTVDPTAVQKYELSENERRQFKEIEEKQQQFHSRLMQKQLTQDETKAVACTTYEGFAQFWTGFCQKSQHKFEDRHRSGWHLWSRKYQGFADGVKDFLNDFQSMLNAVKDFGSPYAGPAIGTLTVLFVVAANKNEMEDAIASALSGIKDRLPGFKMFQDIFRDDHELEKGLQKNILLAYVAFIDLSMEVTRYYFQAGYRRWLIATFRSKKFEPLADRVNERVLAVRLGCEDLVSLNVSQLVHENERLQQKVDNLTTNVENRNLIELQKMLGIEEWYATKHLEDLESYRESIVREQRLETGYEQMYPDNIKRLREDEALASWCQGDMGRPAKSLLILTGISNSLIAPMKRHCWLSPFAIDTINRLTEKSATVAFYIFREPDHTSIEEAVPILIFHLLSSRSHDMGNHQLALAAEAQRFLTHKSRPDSYEKCIAALRRLLFWAVRVFGEEDEVHIVLDRADMCDSVQRDDLLRILVEGMNTAACSIKVLVVTQGESAWKPNERELEAKLRKPATLRHVARTQRQTLGGSMY